MPPKWVQFGFCLEPLVFVYPLYPWLAIQIEPFPAWHLRLQWKYGKVIIRKQYVAVIFQHSPIFLCQSGGLSRTQPPKSINYSLLCVTIGCSASPLPDARHHRDPRLLDIYWPFIVERRWLVGLRSSCQQGALGKPSIQELNALKEQQYRLNMFLRRKECALHSWLTFFVPSCTFEILWIPKSPQRTVGCT